MRIALDVMGGDLSPEAPVRAAVATALAEGGSGLKILLVGPEAVMEPLLDQDGRRARESGYLEFVQAAGVIGPDESPVAALRQKKDSSIVVGLRLVREKRADAFVSAGSTGALMAAAFRNFGRIPGVPRPALASVFPSLGPGGREFLFLDLGANADARPEHLRAYAVMGAVYAEKVMGRPAPRVALLSNGTEAGKGNQLARETHELLTQAPGLGFIGNVEGRDVFSGSFDVLVTDGFTGNVMVKFLEGVVEGLFGVMKEEFMSTARGKAGALLLRPSLRAIKKRLDYTEYGGAPFLGVNAPCVKCHGSSNAKAIARGIAVARRFAAERVIDLVTEQLSALPAPAEQVEGETED